MTKTRKDGSRGRLRIDYSDHRDPQATIAWLWKFIVCRAAGYAEWLLRRRASSLLSPLKGEYGLDMTRRLEQGE